MMKRAKDQRAEPIRRMVALGESTTWGFSVSSKEHCWVNRVVSLLEEFQEEPIELINQGIGSNVITTECPAYEDSAKPAALERLDEEVIAFEPDLLLLSYGLNDSGNSSTALPNAVPAASYRPSPKRTLPVRKCSPACRSSMASACR